MEVVLPRHSNTTKTHVLSIPTLDLKVIKRKQAPVGQIETLPVLNGKRKYIAAKELWKILSSLTATYTLNKKQTICKKHIRELISRGVTMWYITTKYVKPLVGNERCLPYKSFLAYPKAILFVA